MNDEIPDQYISFSIYKLVKGNLEKLKLKPWEFVSTFAT